MCCHGGCLPALILYCFDVVPSRHATILTASQLPGRGSTTAPQPAAGFGFSAGGLIMPELRLRTLVSGTGVRLRSSLRRHRILKTRSICSMYAFLARGREPNTQASVADQVLPNQFMGRQVSLSFLMGGTLQSQRAECEVMFGFMRHWRLC